MYAGALFIQLALQWNIYIAVVLLLSITAVYTIAGELSSRPRCKNKKAKLSWTELFFFPSVCVVTQAAWLQSSTRTPPRPSSCWPDPSSSWPSVSGSAAAAPRSERRAPHSASRCLHFVVFIVRLCGGRRLERSVGRLRQRHTVRHRAKLHLRHPPRRRLPPVQGPGQL